MQLSKKNMNPLSKSICIAPSRREQLKIQTDLLLWSFTAVYETVLNGV